MSTALAIIALVLQVVCVVAGGVWIAGKIREATAVLGERMAGLGREVHGIREELTGQRQKARALADVASDHATRLALIERELSID